MKLSKMLLKESRVGLLIEAWRVLEAVVIEANFVFIELMTSSWIIYCVQLKQACYLLRRFLNSYSLFT